MPTPVSTARQCLTQEAARALDDAVAVARRRSHAQTTSLHAVSALLAPPSSALREACSRARSAAYSPRLQFRALELCVGVSLDRLPTAKASPEEPPVSNSLMAAIKRSQANQRRDPDTFHLYQQIQQQQTQSSLSCVKVELKHFMLSILDDPIVSRVFGEAGFRSCDIKIAILHPPPISRFSRSRCPPLFLCNLPEADPNRRGFSFPFAGFSGLEPGDENSRRIGEILVKKKGKNPLLMGVCAKDALRSFTDCVQIGKNKSGVLPAEINGLNMVCAVKEISEYVAKGENREPVDLKFKEVGDLVEQDSGPCVLANIGELKVLIEENSSIDAANYVVSKLTGLVEAFGDKLRLIGAVGGYEIHKKILARFPSVEKDWDLHVLPITSSTPSSGGFSSRSSLMGSFVPLGGFFATPSDFKNMSSCTNQSTCCGLLNEKSEQEASVILMGGSSTSVADQHSTSLSPPLEMDDHEASKKLDVAKAKEEESVLNAKFMGLQRKFHPDIPWTGSQSQHLEGFRFPADRKESISKGSSSNESGSSGLISSMPTDLRKISTLKQTIPFPVASEAQNPNFRPGLSAEASRGHPVERESSWPFTYPLRNLSLPPDSTSPSSVTSTTVTTDLGLGTLYAATGKEAGKSKFEDHKNRLHYCSGSVSADFDEVGKKASTHFASPSPCSDPVDLKDIKSLWRALTEKVGRQGQAIYAVSQIISRCRTGQGRVRGSNQRGDIWISFLGPDKVGKKRVATALAETVFGSRERLISVDLNPEAGISSSSHSLFERHQNSDIYGVKFRGKTVVDYIGEELSRKPHSVVLLENIDKADLLAQNSLSKAIKTGRLPDSHGRGISISNTIFLTTTESLKANKEIISGKGHVKFSEERILGAKGWQIGVSIGCATGTNGVNKRKLFDVNFPEEDKFPKRASRALKSCLDLNLPVEEAEEDSDSKNCESDSHSESSEDWLEDFFNQVDEKVVFEPFDFDTLAQELLQVVDRSFKKIMGSEVLLVIDDEAMVHILAAAWLSDGKKVVEEWVEGVLSRSFAEAQQMYDLTAQSIVKLVACEGLVLEERAPGLCLPARLVIN
ncbi:hypothetical protein NMG60_11034227 [Bertholletia excelsa]